MRKIMIIFLLFPQFLSVRALAVINRFQQEFPYGLLTDDFGVLTREDLIINECTAKPVAFSEESLAFSYWQCFEVKNARMTCEVKTYDPADKLQASLLVISGNRNGEIHEFISRRSMPLSSCRLYQKDWQNFTENEKHVCISGLTPGKEIKDSETVWTWIFGRYKTKKGCDSYFEGECSLSYKVSHDQCRQ